MGACACGFLCVKQYKPNPINDMVENDHSEERGDSVHHFNLSSP